MPNIEITEVGVNSDGVIDLNELENAIRKDTALVTIMWANNCLLYTSPSPRDRG